LDKPGVDAIRLSRAVYENIFLIFVVVSSEWGGDRSLLSLIALPLQQREVLNSDRHQ
jgi:hypothetical protein